MSKTVPVTLIIPTYNRGMAVLSVLEKVQACDPMPSAIWVHVDLTDGGLERELNERFPDVGVLSSPTRLGPGGGRHRCLLTCNTPYAVSFDDDSYPLDRDFFALVERIFADNPDAAILAARIWHRHEVPHVRSKSLVRAPSYIGCGHAIRLAAYRQVRGYLPRAVSYGMEESDLSLQLFVAGWQIYECGDLRVFHDTELKHHESAEITAASITNIGLYAFLHYPVIGWGWGLLQLANKVMYCIRRARFSGICAGLARIPVDCYQFRRYRRPVPYRTIRQFLGFCRANVIDYSTTGGDLVR